MYIRNLAANEVYRKEMVKMKVRYIGQSFGIDELTSNKIYECLGVEWPFIRVIDDSGEDYLYSATRPMPLTGETPPGRWEIIEDDENGTLQKIQDEVFQDKK